MEESRDHNSRKMAEKKCTESETQVTISAKNVVRFKAGADLSGKLNRAVVEINEERHEDHDLFEIRIGLFREVCEQSECLEN